jgi:hypothetical protein
VWRTASSLTSSNRRPARLLQLPSLVWADRAVFRQSKGFVGAASRGGASGGRSRCEKPTLLRASRAYAPSSETRTPWTRSTGRSRSPVSIRKKISFWRPAITPWSTTATTGRPADCARPGVPSARTGVSCRALSCLKPVALAVSSRPSEPNPKPEFRDPERQTGNAERRTSNAKRRTPRIRSVVAPDSKSAIADAQVGPLLTETDELIRIFETSIRTGQKTGQKPDFDP